MMGRSWWKSRHNLPIRWKLTFWSAALLFLLFSVYSAIQYVYIERSMIKQEQKDLQSSMNDILNFVLERETDFGEQDLPLIGEHLNKVLQKNQLVRITTTDGSGNITVNTGVLPEQVALVSVAEPQWVIDQEDALLILRSPFSIFQTSGTVELASSIAESQQVSNSLLQVMIIFGLVAFMMSLLGGWLLTSQMLRPLQAITSTISRIRKNGLQERVVPVNQGDEISLLINQFNEMMEQLEKSFKQQSQFVQDASHELRTPIAIMEGHLALLRRWGKSDPDILQESLDITFDELDRLKRLVQDLLTLFQVEQEEASIFSEEDESSDPVLVSVSVTQQLSVIHHADRFALKFNDQDRITLAVPEVRLRQIILILLDNALKYSSSDSIITISGVCSDQEYLLKITDAGEGIPSESLPLVMDRFYRVSPARSREKQGYGLGLPIARSLTEKYNGTISIHSELGIGTTVSLTFPLGDSTRKAR